MMTEKTAILNGDQTELPAQKLLVSGLIRLGKPEVDPVELRRGMTVSTQDGQEAGMVAALVLECARQEITHVLLGHLPLTAVYHLLPLSLIDRLDGETVRLSIKSAEIDELPIHQLN